MIVISLMSNRGLELTLGKHSVYSLVRLTNSEHSSRLKGNQTSVFTALEYSDHLDGQTFAHVESNGTGGRNRVKVSESHYFCLLPSPGPLHKRQEKQKNRVSYSRVEACGVIFPNPSISYMIVSRHGQARYALSDQIDKKAHPLTSQEHRQTQMTRRDKYPRKS